jgi:hypothetical protein
MKKLTLAAAAFAFTVPMMANAVHFTLNSSKNYVSVVSKPWKANGKPAFNCYGFSFSGKGKATPVTIPGLAAELDMADVAQLNDVFTWQKDFLLNNVNMSTTSTPNNVPVVPAVTIPGKVSAIKGTTRTITWDNPADNLKMATALISYAQYFPQFLGNATLATTQANGKPLDAKHPNYKFEVKNIKGKVSVTETALVKSTQGACTAYATVKRFYAMP